MTVNGTTPTPAPAAHGFRVTDTNELRARLQPPMLFRVLSPILTVTGRKRFEPGDLVIIQYWGGGRLMLTPVNPRLGPGGWAVAHDVGGNVAQFELGATGQPTEADFTRDSAEIDAARSIVGDVRAQERAER
jgi:hypothetical protein